VIPLVAYSFLGVETVAVTAFEAKSSRSLRLPSQLIAYVILVLYGLLALGETLNVDWRNDHLPTVYNGIANSSDIPSGLSSPVSSSMPVIACWNAGYKTLAGTMNGFLIFSVLSAGNTSLYVASRTLYGLARDVPETNFIGKWLHKASIVVPQTKVPAAALVISALSFIWLPFVQLKGGYAVTAVSRNPDG
jgi:amino acid transporter